MSAQVLLQDPVGWPDCSCDAFRYFPRRFGTVDVQLKAGTCQAMTVHGPLGAVRTGLCRLRDAQNLLHGAFGRMQSAMALAVLYGETKMEAR